MRFASAQRASFILRRASVVLLLYDYFWQHADESTTSHCGSAISDSPAQSMAWPIVVRTEPGHAAYT